MRSPGSYSEKTLHDILKSRWKDYGTALIHYEHTLPTAADGMELSLALSWAPGNPIFLEVFPASFVALHCRHISAPIEPM